MSAEHFTLHTHYDNLKVSRDAPPEVIRAAYKVLVQRCHPDKWDNAAEATHAMQLLSESYAVLIDPQQRREHDAWILREELQQHTWTGAWATPEADRPQPDRAEQPPASTPAPAEQDKTEPVQRQVASLGNAQAGEDGPGAPPLTPEPAAQAPTSAVAVTTQPGPAQTGDPPPAAPPAAAKPETSPEPEPEPAPSPAPATATKPAPRPEAKPRLEPEPEPEPEPQAQARPEPAVAPAPQPAHRPRPEAAGPPTAPPPPQPASRSRPDAAAQASSPEAQVFPMPPAAPPFVPPVMPPFVSPVAPPAAPMPRPQPASPAGRRRHGLRPEVLVAVLAALIVLGTQLFLAGPEDDEADAALAASLAAADVHDLTRPVPPQLQAVGYPQVSKAHPDARVIVASPEFDAWRKQQSAARRAEITRILGQGTPGEVIALLHEYKRQLNDS